MIVLAFALVFGAFALSRPQQRGLPTTTAPAVPVAPVPTAPAPRAAAVPSTIAAAPTLGATYSAVHRHTFGGQCSGIVRLDAMEFRYDSTQHPVRIRRQVVRRIDGAGFVDAAGKKWHFRFQGKSDADVERLLRAWLENGRVK